MKIDLIFDYSRKTINIPEYQTNDIYGLQNEFLEWVSDRKECIFFFRNNNMALSYGFDDFLEFVNTVILKDQQHKAYFVVEKKVKEKAKKNVSIKF